MKKILLSCVTCLLALGLVTACEDEVEEVTPNEPEVSDTGTDDGTTQQGGGTEEINPGTTIQYVEIGELVSGESYYFGYPNGEDYYFFNGELYYTSALYCSENVEEALMVTVTGDDTEGWALTYTGTDSEEYTIYCYLYTDSEKTTTSADITAVKTSELEDALQDDKDAGKSNATATFTWDSEHAGLSVMLGETACYVSTYAQYKEISLSKGNFDYAASHFYSTVETPNPSSIKVSAEGTSVVLGQSLQLTATIDPEDSYPEVVWSSSDETVACVSSSGLVRGLGIGTATITAVSAGNSLIADSVTITVTDRGTAVYQASETIVPGDYYSYVTADSLDLTSETTYGSLVDIKYVQNSGSTKPQYYVNGASIRMYALNQITFTVRDSSVAEISTVEIKYTSNYCGNSDAEVTDASEAAGIVTKDDTAKTLTLSLAEGTTSTTALTLTNWTSSEHYTSDDADSDSSTKYVSGGTQLRIESITINYVDPTSAGEPA